MSASDPTAQVEYREIPDRPGFRFGSDATVWTRWRMGRKDLIGENLLGHEWRPLKPSPRPNGYSWLYLGSQRTTKPIRLDEILCEAFYGPRPSGTECLHADGDRRNCLPSNLRWGVATENIRDPSVEYRTLPEADGYEFGADGSIWSYWATGFTEKTDVCRRIKGNLLESGHIQVTIKWNGENRRFGAHHLACLAYHGPCPEGMECCHGDGIPNNNVPSNLRWGTSKDNAQDAVRHGTMPHGDQHWSSCFQDPEVIEMRNEYAASSITIKDMAIRYGVSFTSMRNLLSGESYKHLPGAVTIRPADFRKLTDSQEEEMCSLSRDGCSIPTLADRFSVSRATVYKILTRRS